MTFFDFRGLCAFPLTPLRTDDQGQIVDDRAVIAIVERLLHAGVDSIGVLGSTGSYAYLDRRERERVARLIAGAAEHIPLLVGVSAISTRAVLENVEDAQQAGAAALLLAPQSYQTLTDDEVYGLYAEVSAEASVPMCIYDNPSTTKFVFSDELLAAIAALPKVAAVKIPPVQNDQAVERIATLRRALPPGQVIGVSGDWFAASALNAGADAWFSVIAGLFPEAALAITRGAQSGRPDDALDRSARLEPLWQLFRSRGSLRVMATASEILGIADGGSLPRPLRGLSDPDRMTLAGVLRGLELDR